jgi:hypothetical protein
VHEHVRPTPPPIGFLDHRGDVAGHGDIGFNRHGFAPAAAMAATISSACGALARWLTTTRYPRLARTNAVAAPIPRLAPVIIATRAIKFTSA